MPERGYCVVTYYSGEGAKRQGCIPKVNLRKALLHLTNTCREQDLNRKWDDEFGWEAAAVNLQEMEGVKFIKVNHAAWLTYMLA